MYYTIYTISTTEGRFNLLNPSEVKFSNQVTIYNDDGSLLKSVSVTADGPIFDDGDEPEEIAEALENWLKGMLYASEEEEIRDMIRFLREHSRELLKGKLRRDIGIIEEKIKRLQEEKEMLRKRYEKLLRDSGKEEV